MPEELYRIQDLCFQKDHSFLINHLDMYQYKGESLGLLGLHDSGKTLLSLILSGQVSPAQESSVMRKTRHHTVYSPPTLH